MYGSQNEKMKNWETKSEGYTSEEKGRGGARYAAYTAENA